MLWWCWLPFLSWIPKNKQTLFKSLISDYISKVSLLASSSFYCSPINLSLSCPFLHFLPLHLPLDQLIRQLLSLVTRSPDASLCDLFLMDSHRLKSLKRRLTGRTSCLLTNHMLYSQFKQLGAHMTSVIVKSREKSLNNKEITYYFCIYRLLQLSFVRNGGGKDGCGTQLLILKRFINKTMN